MIGGNALKENLPQREELPSQRGAVANQNSGRSKTAAEKTAAVMKEGKKRKEKAQQVQKELGSAPAPA